MLALKSLTLLTLLQGITCYCIYNKLTDGTSITVHQDGTETPMGEAFSQFLEPSRKACYHYAEKDSLSNENDNYLVDFFIDIHAPDGYIMIIPTECTAGGTLYIRGTKDMKFAECVDPDGYSYAEILSYDSWETLL